MMSVPKRWLENRWLGLAIVFAIGVALRTIRLADVPGGIFHDEAWSAVKAMAILDGEASPQVYFAENNGMDAAHVYGIAALFALTGPLAIGSRLVSSLMGSLTVLATYWAAWELFAEQRHRHGLSLISAFVVATLFWALTTSRSAWHVPWMTLATTLSLAALFRGRRLVHRRWFVIAGLLAGLAQYTYPSARFLPALLLLLAALDLWDNRPARRTVILNYLSLVAAAAIVFAPLGVYFAQNPEWFFVRAQQTADAASLDLGHNLIQTLAGFSIYGDSEGLHNLNGRPALDAILTIFFIAGLIVCLAKRRAAHPSTAPSPSPRSGSGLRLRAGLILIAWLIVFSLPVVLTGQAPLFRRWTGILPAQAMLAALGAVALADLVRERIASRAGRASRLVPIAVAASLMISAALSVADYFGPYASAPTMFWAYDRGITQVAEYIASRPDTTVFLTPYDRFYEVVAITLAEAGRAPIQSYNGRACAVFPETTSRETEWVVITEQDDRTLPLAQQLFPAGEIVWQIDSPIGAYARAWHVSAGQTARLKLDQRGRADLGGKVRLIGYELPESIRPGETLRVAVALEATSPLEQRYKVFVHLRGEGDSVLAQADRLPCNFSLNEADWRPGDIVLEEYTLPISPETAPGTYRVILGVYRPDTHARLPVLSSDPPHTGDGVVLGEIDVK
ncbi:MAG TPA: hypothetical protein VFL17_05910 [Anaerolineae bacterium]|nr:hypothetical protein [Anaerolineae bacterium]